MSDREFDAHPEVLSQLIKWQEELRAKRDPEARRGDDGVLGVVDGWKKEDESGGKSVTIYVGPRRRGRKRKT